ncbi:Protein vreteno [Anthophora plagiata]
MAYCENFELNEDPSPSNRKEFTLYINNLPGELTEHGLLQIFNHYGTVKGHFYRSNTSWAYITYNMYREAENAIKDLDNKPPLRLQISFAKEKGSNANSNPSVPLTKIQPLKNVAQQPENHNVPNVELTNKSLGPSKLLNVLKKIKPNPTLPKYTYTEDDDLLYPYPSDVHTYNPYENAEPYASTNTLWTRGQLTITEDGKRHVSLGRGYTMYEIPYPDPEVHNYISKVYEKRNPDLYEYGKDMLQSAVEICKICSKKTKFTCERCYNMFYCSRDCQVKDWPRHKVECEAVPSLVTAIQSVSVSQSNTREKTPSRNISNVQIPLRRPKKCTNRMATSNEAVDAVSEDQTVNNVSTTVGNNNANNSSSEYLHSEAGINHVKHQKNDGGDKLRIPRKSYSSVSEKSLQKGIQNDDSNKLNIHKSTNKILPNFNIDDVQKMEEDISFPIHTFLSKTEFKDVKIIEKQNREFWIQKVEDESNIAQLMVSLQDDAEKAQTVEPICGNIYAVKYENIWHRALVTSVLPVKVHYIDYGNDETLVSRTNFREINKYKDIPHFSAKIRLSDAAYEKYKNVKYEDVITVKMISIDSNEVISVEVQDENNRSTSKVTGINDNPVSHISNTSKVSNNSPVSSKTSTNNNLSNFSSKFKSIISALTVGKTGFLEIGAKLKNNTYDITLLPCDAQSDYEKLVFQLPTVCEEIAEHSHHSPGIGDLICGLTDDQWWRGYIVSLKPSLKMALVDASKVASVNKTIPCPENFLDIYAFGAMCEVADAKHEFSVHEEYQFEVVKQNINKEQDKIEIEISKGQDKLKAFVKPWIPLPEQTGLLYFELKSGSEVSITAYRSHILLFVRSLDSEALEYYNYVMQNVAKCAQTSPSLKEPPVVGQIVIGQYVDENYYRAIVTKIQDDKIAISYIDFGNTEVTNIKKLKPLTDDLKQLRSCVAKVILNDVPKDVPMTKDVSDYLAHLVGTEVPLTCTFNGIPFKDGVHLKLHNGESVNKVISELLVPTSKETAEEDKTCYMLDDISTISLGNVGSIIEVIILHRVDDAHTYAMCPLDHDIVTHIFDTLPPKINAYCKTSDCYIPRKKELCLAFYKDGWYRAACLCRSSTATTCKVFFIDYGNTEDVNHKDIRLMPREFVTPSALANICNIINIPKHNGQCSSDMKKVLELLAGGLVDLVPAKIKIVAYDSKAEIYEVELCD